MIAEAARRRDSCIHVSRNHHLHAEMTPTGHHMRSRGHQRLTDGRMTQTFRADCVQHAHRLAITPGHQARPAKLCAGARRQQSVDDRHVANGQRRADLRSEVGDDILLGPMYPSRRSGEKDLKQIVSHEGYHTGPKRGRIEQGKLADSQVLRSAEF